MASLLDYCLGEKWSNKIQNKRLKSCGLGKNLVILRRNCALDSVKVSLATCKFIKMYGQNIL